VEAPEQINPQNVSDYLAVMTKAVFQSGMSWAVVANKWQGINEVFHGFDPVWIAGLTPPDIDALMQDTRLIRNRKKIEAIVHNAGTLLEIEQTHGSVKAYLGSFPGFEEASADVRKRFKFLGDLGAYYVLYVVGEPVPDHDEWRKSREK
jgi:3-methyladenine DNA glycosylase Tag